MENEKKDAPNKIKYSIWDTRTKENLDRNKEKFAEALENSTPESKTTDNRSVDPL